jgi:hypothetical protein
VIAPRLVSVSAGAAAVGRHFRYNAPLQRESTFARPAIAADLETFPLHALDGAARGLGLRFSLSKPLGGAEIQQAAYVTERRSVSIDRMEGRLLFALPATPIFVFVPSVGWGRSRFAVDQSSATIPSACVNTSAEICLPRVRASYGIVSLASRLALGRSIALEVDARYHHGLGVERGYGTLGAEAPVTAYGLGADAGLRFALGAHVAATIGGGHLWTRYAFKGAEPYSTATESTPWARVGLWVGTGP